MDACGLLQTAVLLDEGDASGADWHLSEEEADAFSLGRLSGEDLDVAEMHLLTCEACRLKVTQTDTLREALAAVELFFAAQ